jgi:A/G-specific adenine glycosylase
MLQQTRVAVVVPYYERFLERFPNVEVLAAAPEEDLLACWSGLGYYSRARNLLRAARLIAEAGGFPRDYESIRKLPGIGDYTAAAIASIALVLPRAALDGNVGRVLARLLDERGDTGSAKTRKRLEAAAAHPESLRKIRRHNYGAGPARESSAGRNPPRRGFRDGHADPMFSRAAKVP